MRLDIILTNGCRGGKATRDGEAAFAWIVQKFLLFSVCIGSSRAFLQVPSCWVFSFLDTLF